MIPSYSTSVILLLLERSRHCHPLLKTPKRFSSPILPWLVAGARTWAVVAKDNRPLCPNPPSRFTGHVKTSQRAEPSLTPSGANQRRSLMLCLQPKKREMESPALNAEQKPAERGIARKIKQPRYTRKKREGLRSARLPADNRSVQEVVHLTSSLPSGPCAAGPVGGI